MKQTTPTKKNMCLFLLNSGLLPHVEAVADPSPHYLPTLASPKKPALLILFVCDICSLGRITEYYNIMYVRIRGQGYETPPLSNHYSTVQSSITVFISTTSSPGGRLRSLVFADGLSVIC